MSDPPADPRSLAVEMRGIVKRFPGVVANDGVDFDLRLGEVHALLGENGAGKSTLMNVLDGLYRPEGGAITVFGRPAEFRSPRDAIAAGLGMVHQHFALVPTQTVTENVLLGLPRPRFRLDAGRYDDEIADLAGRHGLAVDPRARIWQLSVGEQQRVEILKMLYRGARILILDEPTASLTNKEVDTLFETIRKLKAHGVSMLYISHRLDEIFQIADRVTVIRDGEHIYTEVVAKVTKDQLVSWMVGRTLTNLYPKESCEIGDVVFEARGIVQAGVLKGIDLQLRKGEILGISGLAGAGRTELALALCGFTRLDSGQILIDGKPVRFSSYRQAMDKGIVYISEDRQKYGLIVPMSISVNITLPLLARISRGPGIIDFSAERKINDTYMERLSIKAPNGAFIVNNLSGGNQQKVSVAKALATTPRILILDEPTRGVDVGAKSEIHRIISNLAKEGKSIIMISSDLPEIIGMSDRVIVMKTGSKMGELTRDELSQPKILQLAL